MTPKTLSQKFQSELRFIPSQKFYIASIASIQSTDIYIQNRNERNVYTEMMRKTGSNRKQ